MELKYFVGASTLVNQHLLVMKHLFQVSTTFETLTFLCKYEINLHFEYLGREFIMTLPTESTGRV